MFRFSPGRCCCRGAKCDIIPLDPQGTADDVTQVAGSFSFSGPLDNGVTTASDNALLLHNKAMPTGMKTLHAQFLGGCGASDQIRFVVLYNAPDDYWYAQCVPGASDGQLKLYHVTSGPTHTQIGATQAIVDWDGSDLLHCEFCITLENLAVRAILEGQIPEPNDVAGLDVPGSYVIAGTKAGWATGTIAGTATFYRIAAIRLTTDPDKECLGTCFDVTEPPEAECEEPFLCCTNVTLPATLTLNILPGWFDGRAQCGVTSPCQIWCAHDKHPCDAPGDPGIVDQPLTKIEHDCFEIGSGAFVHRYAYDTGSIGGSGYCYFDRIRIYCGANGAGPGQGQTYAAFGDGALGNGLTEYCTVAMEILTCDPFHARSLDGGLEVTE